MERDHQAALQLQQLQQQQQQEQLQQLQLQQLLQQQHERLQQLQQQAKDAAETHAALQRDKATLQQQLDNALTQANALVVVVVVGGGGGGGVVDAVVVVTSAAHIAHSLINSVTRKLTHSLTRTWHCWTRKTLFRSLTCCVTLKTSTSACLLPD